MITWEPVWEPLTLQRECCEGGYLVWRDYSKGGKPVTAPVEIDELPWGKYQLVE